MLDTLDMPMIRMKQTHVDVMRLLSRLAYYSPCPAVIQQCASDAGVVGCHNVYSPIAIGGYPHSSSETSDRYGCLANPLIPNPCIDMCVQGEAVVDVGTAVCELFPSCRCGRTRPSCADWVGIDL